MSLSLGRRLMIRAMVYTAAEPVPFFWPMRSFIHHNPLHGLEHMPFHEAAERGRELFHGSPFLTRSAYQAYLARDKVDLRELEEGVARQVAGVAIPGIDLPRWLMTLLTDTGAPLALPLTLADPAAVHAALHGRAGAALADGLALERIAAALDLQLLGDRPVYESVDLLYGTRVGAQLDELVIKSCLDFFDEGQSAWAMPERERGLFAAWRELALRNVRVFLRGVDMRRVLADEDGAEAIVVKAMQELQVPESRWVGYFAREIARLHGWAGFIRWRSTAKHYHWAQRYPADLVDYLAVRLTVALALLEAQGRRGRAHTAEALQAAVARDARRTYLRCELHGGTVLPAMAQRVETTLALGGAARTARLFDDYVVRKRTDEAERQAARLRDLAGRADQLAGLARLGEEDLARLLGVIREFERGEGMLWLWAMESRAMQRLTDGLSLMSPPPRDKRPFVQALFCIDTRSERIRRHLEAIGDYQTYGIAGFFGVPVSFIELGKGSETHLCPVLLTPRNLVLEMSTAAPADEAALTALGKAMHHLKESVLTPFVTVEAIGLLFGLDMIGKTLAPSTYNRWRKRLHPARPPTQLLLDKLSREQADSIVRAVQRAVIVKAVEQDLGTSPERITDDLVRALREAALGHAQDPAVALAALPGVDGPTVDRFVQRLRSAYRINPSFAQLQMERLGRIGFSLDEQARFVGQALRSIGLTGGFSRFVLLVGHGSSSENNPFESALDCGACGGNQGLVNARALAQMANKPAVRQRLRESGLQIADDAWFVPALHNTTTDEITLHDLELLPPPHLVYLDRLRNGIAAAARLCASERLPTLQPDRRFDDPGAAARRARRNAMDWSQVRPEWGLSGNAYFIIGPRRLTEALRLDGRAFLHSYDYRLDPRRRLLETILSGPLIVGQWINMEHYFSTVDSECYGSGSKVYHNVAGRFGIMTGNLSDLRTGLPAQTVLRQGEPYHEPLRLVAAIEAPLAHARRAVESVVAVRRLVRNGWIRLLVIDPETATTYLYDDGQWQTRALHDADLPAVEETRPT